MNTNNIFSVKKTAMILFSVLFLFPLVFTSCENDEDNVSRESYFNIEGDPTGLSVNVNGATKGYVVRSNRSWQVVAQEEGDWVKSFPAEGEDDGIFKFIVDENTTFETRTINFAFIVDGQEQPVLFRVEQEANIPYITILDAENGVSAPSSGGNINISIKANVNWTYSLDDESWLSGQKVSDTEIKLLAERNISGERTVNLTVTSEQYPSLAQEIVITQSAGNVILEEDFNWLVYGSTVPYEYKDAVRYDSWTQKEKDRGWTVTPNEYSKNQQLCYACVGYVKLGKTSYGGDLVSPKLDIEGTATVKVTFKSAVYISAGGNVDDRMLKVFALGSGETSVSEFTIDNIPNSQAEDEAGAINNIWDTERAYSFTITGATSETQIKFLGGDYYLKDIGQGKNRIFLDDIKVEIIE